MKMLSHIVPLVLASLSISLGQVPQIINYQGRVVVDGTNFHGTGQFKFSLVDGGTTITPSASTATATAQVVNGFIVGYTVTDGGAGYVSVPSVTITDPTGSGAVATANLSNGHVTSLTVSNPGHDYSVSPTVTIAAPPTPTPYKSYITLWSNDGTGTGGAAPDAAVPLKVEKGLYAVQLGDTGISNMVPIPSTVFTNGDVRLRAWFDDGSHGWQQFDPDQRIAAVGYAMVADSAQTVPDGSITSAKIASGAIGSGHIGAGAISAANIATGSITGDLLAPGSMLSNLNAAGQGGVPSGGIVCSVVPNDSNLLLAGYFNVGELPNAMGQWRTGLAAPMAGRRHHAAAWTGSKMIVWGGYGTNNTYLITGALYDPESNIWSAMTTNGAPRGRTPFTSVWTGTNFIVWGGGGGPVAGYLNDGGSYNPISNTWSAISTNGAPSPRRSNSALWTGTEMIIWGGDQNWVPFGDGKRYDPVSNTWSSMSTNGAPSARSLHTAIWTGEQMIVWGGYDGSASLNNGARYNPISDTWSSMSTNGAPTSRRFHTAVWTGSEMLIWGGDNGGTPRTDAARYNPMTDTWTSIAAANAPSARTLHTAVWTGTRMIIWGGTTHSFLIGSDGTRLTNGASYNPISDSWTPLPNSGSPTVREIYSSVWTGNEMIVFGGFNGTQYLNDTYLLDSEMPLYLYMRP